MGKFSENLKRIREQRGMTRLDLAAASGISNAAVGYYENGKREPQASTLTAIAAALRVSTDELLGYDPSESLTYKQCVQFIERAKLGNYDIGVVLFADGEHVRITDKLSADILNDTAKDNPDKNIGLPIAKFSTRQEFMTFVQNIEQNLLKNPLYQDLLSIKLDSARKERDLQKRIADFAEEELQRTEQRSIDIGNRLNEIREQNGNDSDK